MDNLDLVVLRTLRDWRLAGRRALLATVVRTWGSSPRPIGSIMALCEDGSVVGSVSGGCIEDDLIYRYTQAYSDKNQDFFVKFIKKIIKQFIFEAVQVRYIKTKEWKEK